MLIEIKKWFNGAVLFSHDAEVNSIRITLEAGVRAKADLSGADLRGADLCDADLRGADLCGADLRGADLCGADLCGADLCGADLCGADLCDADLCGAVTDVPVATDEQAIANLDRVRALILEEPKLLNMGDWHETDDWKERSCAEEVTCGTTHCLAGWLQVCSTDPKIRKLDPSTAGVVLAPVASKMFYRGEREVMDWLKDRKYVKELAA